MIHKLLPLTLSMALAFAGLATVPTPSLAGNIIIADRSDHHHRAHRGPGRRAVVVAPRVRHVRGVRVVRPYGPAYLGYGHFYTDDEAYKWMAFTAITVKLLDNVNEEQQRHHEAAQVKATTAKVGETIVWGKGDASGSVTTTRVGTSTSGRQCREFQQSVTVGGKSEQAYGTACLQPDGSWEIVQP